MNSKYRRGDSSFGASSSDPPAMTAGRGDFSSISPALLGDDHAIPEGQPGRHLDLLVVPSAELDPPLLLARWPGHPDRGLAQARRHQAAGDHQGLLLIGDEDLDVD